MTVADNFCDEILQIFCDDFDEYLVSNNKEIRSLDSPEFRWLTVRSDEVIQNTSFFESFKFNSILRKEKHLQKFKKGFAALIRISEDTGSISYITPLSPINIVNILDSTREKENLIDISNLFDIWVTEVQMDKFKQIIKEYWINYFNLSNFDLTISYSSRQNEIKFVINSNLRNPSNIRQYFKRVKKFFPKKFNLKIDKKKQQIVFFIATTEEIYKF